MANFIFNISKGRVVARAQNVEDNSPAGAVIRIFALSVTGDQDAAMIDVDNMAALFALANVAEVTNTGYANKSIAAAGLTITVDDTNDRVELFVGDQTFSSIAAGDAWTDLVYAYDPDGTDTDANTIPLTLHDFAVTPNGGDILADEGANGFFRGT